MFFRAGDDDTICALSTPPGTGGIAVIRVSGREALAYSRQLCRFLPEKPASHHAHFGVLRSMSAGEAIDEVVALYFADGRSFTGEETVEISCHGGPTLAATILRELVATGCRTAMPGEFTYRAFMNGRLDLVQAESVLSLIESKSQSSAKVALRQLQGHLSADLGKIEDELLWILAHLEASIDFSTEGLETVSSRELVGRMSSLEETVGDLLSTYSSGRILKDGLEIALAGKPNVGKSSLLNALLKQDRAIVTPHAGTTRDTVEGTLSIGGLPVTLVDTAGLRETDHEIERIGIERSRLAMKRADLVFQVVDAAAETWREDVRGFAAERAPTRHLIVNKVDLLSAARLAELDADLASHGLTDESVFKVSALAGSGLREIEALIARSAQTTSESSNVIMQARHMELLQKIHSCLHAALRLVREDSSPEFVAFELQEAIRAIHELLGKEFDEQVIDRVFKEFCLGK